MEIEYEFREQDLVHFNETRLQKSEEIRQNLKKNRLLVPGVMVLIAAFYYFYYGDRNATAYILVLAGMWAWLSPKLILLDLQRQILSKYSAKEKASMFGIYTLTIDPATPQYLLEKSPSGKHKMQWADLLRVEYGKRHVYIYIDMGTALVIPIETVKKGNLMEFAKQAEKLIERLG
jgi:hypothetical protein